MLPGKGHGGARQNAGRKRARLPENPPLPVAPSFRNAGPARTVEAARQERERMMIDVKRKIGLRALKTTRVVENEKSFESARKRRVQHHLERLRDLAREAEGFNVK
jgi:hypothetical protein